MNLTREGNDTPSTLGSRSEQGHGGFCFCYTCAFSVSLIISRRAVLGWCHFIFYILGSFEIHDNMHGLGFCTGDLIPRTARAARVRRHQAVLHHPDTRGGVARRGVGAPARGRGRGRGRGRRREVQSAGLAGKYGGGGGSRSKLEVRTNTACGTKRPAKRCNHRRLDRPVSFKAKTTSYFFILLWTSVSYV